MRQGDGMFNARQNVVQFLSEKLPTTLYVPAEYITNTASLRGDHLPGDPAEIATRCRLYERPRKHGAEEGKWDAPPTCIWCSA